MSYYDMKGQQVHGNQYIANRDQYIAGGDMYIQRPAEPEVNLEEAEVIYRRRVVTAYNHLNFEGFEHSDVGLKDASLEDIFVRLTLTVEPHSPKGVSSEEADQARYHADRQEEPPVIDQKPLEVSDTLRTNLLIFGEPGAGKSTLLHWLAVTFARGCQREVNRLGPSADVDRLPVFIELGSLLLHYGEVLPSWPHLLPEYISTQQEAFFGTPPQLLRDALIKGRCLLLFDGLDEVTNIKVRARLVRSLVEFARLSPNTRIIIGSRHLEMNVGTLQPTFRCCRIARFTSDDIQRFFHFWYALDHTVSPEQQRISAEALYARIQMVPKLLELATTPLLSTILVLIWRNEGALPRRRVDLYERCCRILIGYWEDHHDVVSQGIFAELDWERHLQILAPLAYAIHSRKQQTSADREELLPVLAKSLQAEGLCSDGARATIEAEQFLKTLGLRSGLLQHLGGNRYGFPHLTFQEYLAARFIAKNDSGYIGLVMAHLHESWWQEVHLLTIGHLGSGGEQTPRAATLLQNILGLYPRPRESLMGGFSRVQLDRHIAWTLGREFELAVNAVAECAPDSRLEGVKEVLAEQAVFLARQFLSHPYRIKIQQGLLRTITRVPIGARVLIDYLSHANSEYFREQDQWINILNQLTEAELAQSEKETMIKLVLSVLQDLGYQTPTKHSRAKYDWLIMNAVRYLGRFGNGNQEAVKTLLIVLQNPNYVVREAVAESLGLLGMSNEEVIKALFQMIYHEETRAVRAAAQSLARLGATDKAVLQEIQRVAQDPNGRARGHIAWCLGWLGTEYEFVVPTLLQLAHDPDWMVRSPAIESLTWLRLEDKTIVQTLFRARFDENDSVRAGAIEGLEWLAPGNKNAIPVLQQMLYWDSLTRACARDSLERIAKSNLTAIDAFLQALNDPNCPDRSSIVRGLKVVGVGKLAVVDALLQTLQTIGNGLVRDEIIRILGELRIPSDVVVKTLFQALDEPDVDTRQAAVESLGNLGRSNELIIDALLEKLLDENWEGYKECKLHVELAKSLGTLGRANKRIVHVFQQILYAEVSDAVKIALKTDQHSEEHWVLLMHYKEQLSVQYAVAESLGMLTTTCEEAMKLSQKALKHKNKEVQFSVIKGLKMGISVILL
jgi:HEAT repeat protein